VGEREREREREGTGVELEAASADSVSRRGFYRDFFKHQAR
jgi:hypothetical protein